MIRLCSTRFGILKSPKIKFFLQKLCHNGLPTKKRLELSHIFRPLECVFFNFHSEDASQIFSRCPLIKDVFDNLEQKINLSISNVISDNMSFVEFLYSFEKEFSMVEIEIFVIFLVVYLVQ